MTNIYFNDEQYCCLDDLKEAISDAWRMPELGEYIDEEGTTTETPPFNKPIVVKRLSELLIERVEGYE